MLPPRVFGGIQKKEARPIAVCNNFQEGFGHYTDQKRHIKGENRWESTGSLHSNELDIEGLKAAQRNELIVPGQNIAFSSQKKTNPNVGN